MKRALIAIVTLALLLTSALPALAAELPDCFVPTAMMMGLNQKLPMLFRTLGDADPAGTSAIYILSNPELLGNGMRFSNDDGDVTLEAMGNPSPSAPADTMTLTIGSGVNAFHAAALKTAFLGVVADSDGAVSSDELMAWLSKASTDGDLSLNGYTLSLRRDIAGQSLVLTAGNASGNAGGNVAVDEPEPAPTEVPDLPEETTPADEVAELPPSFIPQITATYFNGLLSQTLDMLGAPNPESMAEDFKLTKADIVDKVLFLSSSDGKVEISAYYEDGQPAVDRQATTLGLAMANDLDRSEMLSISATFAVVLSETDSTVGDFGALLDWMSDAVDAGDTAIRPMNGYNLVYARGDNGYMYTLVPGALQPASAATAEPEATPEPTPVPTVEPTATPEPTPELPESLDGAILEWNGLYVKPLRYAIHAYSSEHVTLNLYFRILNTTDQLIRIDVSELTIDGNTNVHAASIGKAAPCSDSGDDPSDYMLVNADYGTGTSGLEAIANARKINISVVLKDEDFNRLYTQDIAVDLDSLEGTRDVPDDFKAEVRPTSVPDMDASNFKTLKQGSKGQAVRELQQRLIDLCYLDGKADGSYGKKTVAAVRTFCEQNGLGTDGGNATPEMQAKLFSGSAKAYSEAYIPLVIGAKSNYDPVRSVNTFFFKVQVINTSKSRTVRGFELQCYSTDVWGNKLDNGVVYTMTNTVRVKPGETTWSNSFNLGNWYSVDTVWVGISKIVFDDGEIRTVDDVEYYSCVMPSKK